MKAIEKHIARLENRVNDINKLLSDIDPDTDQSVNLRGELEDLEIKIELLEDRLNDTDHENIYGILTPNDSPSLDNNLYK